MSGSELLVGVDVGTTSAKAAVVSLDGRELSHGRAPMPWRQVSTGAEIAPDALVGTALAAVSGALGGGPDGPVVGLGVTGMAETGVLLDGAGTPVAPAIAWHDSRGAQEVRRLDDRLGPGRFTERTGLEVRPLCSASKYQWLRGHVEGAERGCRWLGVAEWVVHRLGGDHQAELSLASRTGWLDLASRGWWQESLEACGAPAGLLPEPVVAGTAAGRVAAAHGRLAGAVLTVGGHDHLCAAAGVGAVGDGDVFDSCGTAEAFIAPVAPPVPAADVSRLVSEGVSVGWHVVPDRQALLGAQRAGLELQRFLDLLGVCAGQRDALDSAAAAAPPGAGGLVVLGLEEDEMTLAGIPRRPAPGLVWRAALEAVTERSAAILSRIEGLTGPTRRLVVGGGWARSAALRDVKRARLGPFTYPCVGEPGARGAALLAGLAAGRYPAVDRLPAPPDERTGDR